MLITKGRELEVLGSGIVVVLDAHDYRHNTIYDIEPGEVFSIRHLRLHLLAQGQRFTLPQIVRFLADR